LLWNQITASLCDILAKPLSCEFITLKISVKAWLHIRGLPRVSTPHDTPREHALFASIDLY
jgi:hypothetical protein